MNEDLIKALENVLTIDGRGRPKKALLLLELLEKYGVEEITAKLKEFGERRFF